MSQDFHNVKKKKTKNMTQLISIITNTVHPCLSEHLGADIYFTVQISELVQIIKQVINRI